LSKQDFLASIHTLLRRFEQQTQVAVTLNVTGDGLPLSPQQQLQVVFILQEALSNVRKHAFAQHVLIEIEREGDFVLRITDDGVGFDKDALLAKRSQHVGTAIMQERAQMVRAQVVLRSIVQQGTVVELTLPSQERVAV
jgi:two-component system nitrate/nitrite sensor histidine kinase NarX